MKRVLSLALACAVILPFAARAQGKTDFSGTWTLDPSKSDAPMGRGGRGGGAAAGPITITQTASQLTQKRGEQTLTYTLDGSESKNQVQGRGGMQDVTSKAHWDGAKLIVETTRDMGGMSITTKETRSLSADGKEMTIENAISTPQGDLNTKQVFTKS
ncbi:MAG: hypothetical protein LAO77_01105 [Acidobacteriia bacterium]|nr:hypothetical protein [Terriglobia bacterium]